MFDLRRESLVASETWRGGQIWVLEEWEARERSGLREVKECAWYHNIREEKS